MTPSPHAMKLFIAAIVLVGLIRFALTVSDVPDDLVRFASMTAVIAAGTLYFGVVSPTRIARLKNAYWLILPYMIVEVTALGYTWASGRQTIFHAPQYSFGTGLALHTFGHLIGGLTWEPLMLFVLMEVIHGVHLRWFD
jgi:hypothetical protein